MAEQVKKKFVPVITPAAREYLQIQQGRISNLQGEAWDLAYCNALHANLREIRHLLPETIAGVLDIGGGMGGIDALINHEYGGTLDVVIVDGDQNLPVVTKPDQPYSNCSVAFDFLCANGVIHPKFLTAPDKPQTDFEPAFLRTIEPVDLVLGVQSWGFHFPPSLHMALAFAFSKIGTVWILDVRQSPAGSPWAVDLFSQERLEPIGEVPGLTDKYSRLAFKVVS